MDIPVRVIKTPKPADQEFHYLKTNNVLAGLDDEQIVQLLLRLQREKLADVMFLVSDLLDRPRVWSEPGGLGEVQS